jgi:hypothetical protein
LEIRVTAVIDPPPEQDDNQGIKAVWLEKYAVFRQESLGVRPEPLDFLLLTEVVPATAESKYTVSLARDSATHIASFRDGARLSFINDMLLNRLARSHASADELNESFADTTYTFHVSDALGQAELTLDLGGGTGTCDYPNVPELMVRQHRRGAQVVDHSKDVVISWDAFETDGVAPGNSDWFAANTIFVLIDNGRGELVFSSGVVPPTLCLNHESRELKIPAGVLEAGMRYTIFVCFVKFRATATILRGSAELQGAAVNSVAVELPFATNGSADPGRTCPPWAASANYRWPGKLPSSPGLHPWPLDDSGLMLDRPSRARSSPTS